MKEPSEDTTTLPPFAEVLSEAERVKVSVKNSRSLSVTLATLVTSGPESTVGVPAASWVLTMVV